MSGVKEELEVLVYLREIILPKAYQMIGSQVANEMNLKEASRIFEEFNKSDNKVKIEKAYASNCYSSLWVAIDSAIKYRCRTEDSLELYNIYCNEVKSLIKQYSLDSRYIDTSKVRDEIAKNGESFIELGAEATNDMLNSISVVGLKLLLDLNLYDIRLFTFIEKCFANRFLNEYDKEDIIEFYNKDL